MVTTRKSGSGASWRRTRGAKSRSFPLTGSRRSGLTKLSELRLRPAPAKMSSRVFLQIVRRRQDENTFDSLAEMQPEVPHVTCNEVRRPCLHGCQEIGMSFSGKERPVGSSRRAASKRRTYRASFASLRFCAFSARLTVASFSAYGPSQPAAVNEEVPRRIGGRPTGESIPKGPCTELSRHRVQEATRA